MNKCSFSFVFSHAQKLFELIFNRICDATIFIFSLSFCDVLMTFIKKRCDALQICCDNRILHFLFHSVRFILLNWLIIIWISTCGWLYVKNKLILFFNFAFVVVSFKWKKKSIAHWKILNWNWFFFGSVSNKINYKIFIKRIISNHVIFDKTRYFLRVINE